MATKPTLNDLMYEYYFGLEGTPVTAAGAPTSPVATAGAGFVSVAFVAPASTGSEPILGYEVTLSNGRVASGTSSPIVVPTPGGSAVTATVKAFNGALGVASAASNSVTPTAVATVPGAPTVGTLTPGQAQVSLAFTAPASNGGSAVTDYRVTLSNGQIGSGAASPIVVAGVPSSPPVSATVSARNVYGYGPESAVSNAVTATPEAPGAGGPTPSNGGGIGGVAIGEVGTGVLAGFKLAAGDDFDAPVTRWHGRNLTGRYAHSALSIAFRRTNSSNDHMMYIDPVFRGARSQSPTDLGYDGTSVAGSVLTLTASAPPSELLPFLPTNYGGLGDGFGRPRLISGSLKTAPSFMVSMQADMAVECYAKLPPGQARGHWSSFWTTSFFWPDFGEIDVLEGKKADSSGAVTTTLNNVIVSAADGGGSMSETVSQPVIPTDRFVRLLCVKQGTTLSFYDDADVQGVLALRGTTTTRVSRLRGAHDIRLDLAVAGGWDNTSQNMADWPNNVQFDWWRAWVPATAGDNTPVQVLAEVNTTPGGSWAATLPSRVALFGAGAGIEQVCAAWDNLDSPGMPTRNAETRLPTSMTVNLTTRAITGTVPATEGGRMGVLVTYAYNDGTPAGRAILPYNVAPAIQALFDSSVVTPGTAVSLSIPYTAFHSGNLGPHTYNVTAPGLVVTGNGTGNVSIAGTAGADGTSQTITINVTNAIGQTTTVTRTVSSVAGGEGFDPNAWSSAVEWWDADDNTKVFSDSVGTTAAIAGTSKAARLVGRKLGIALANPGGVTVPTYVTDANTRKAIRFTAASTQFLNASDAAIATLTSGNDAPYAIVMAAKRGAASVSVTPIALCRNDAGTVADLARHFFSGSNTVGVTRTAAGAAVTAASTGSSVGANQWYVVSWLFDGTALTVRLNGTTIASGLTLNTGAVTLTDLVLGATYGNSSDSYDPATAFDGHIGEFGLLQAVTAGDSTLAAAEAYLMAKWTN